MKPTLHITLEPQDLLGEVGDPQGSPLARAMTRTLGTVFRHTGSILYATHPNTSMVSHIYECGQPARTLWREWAVQRVPLTNTEFMAKLMPKESPVITIELTPEGKLPPSETPFRPYEEQGPIPQGVHAS
jgi:hypothetical protein